MISDAFEGFAQSLRILLEAVYRANELLFVDSHEAAGNIEQALTGALNSTASIYDSIRNDDRFAFDWYGTPETATILSIRNARHHNIASRIRGLYTYHLQRPNPETKREYLLVDYPETSDGGDTFDVPISWHDMRQMLSMPQSENKLRRSAAEGIGEYLESKTMDTYSAKFGVSKEAVFFNVTPLLVNAACKFLPVIRPFINARSTEAKVYYDLFMGMEPANTKVHVVSKFPVFLPS